MLPELLKLSIPKANSLGLGAFDEKFIANGLWIIYGVTFVLWLAVTVVLLYHWKNYGYKRAKTAFMSVVYISGSIFLLLLALSGIVTYTV
ncbi:MAG TPA: hypothetical protein ENI66_02380 [Candidatus Yonathbacteria bacterium]|nr:hypothetical protein [Candidatus Yonathbacteria bacterium]